MDASFLGTVFLLPDHKFCLRLTPIKIRWPSGVCNTRGLTVIIIVRKKKLLTTKIYKKKLPTGLFHIPVYSCLILLELPICNIHKELDILGMDKKNIECVVPENTNTPPIKVFCTIPVI